MPISDFKVYSVFKMHAGAATDTVHAPCNCDVRLQGLTEQMTKHLWHEPPPSDKYNLCFAACCCDVRLKEMTEQMTEHVRQKSPPSTTTPMSSYVFIAENQDRTELHIKNLSMKNQNLEFLLFLHVIP